MISLTAGLSSSTFSGSGFNFNICADPRVEGQADLFHSTRSDILDFPDAKARQTTQSAWDELIHLLALSLSESLKEGQSWQSSSTVKATESAFLSYMISINSHKLWVLFNIFNSINPRDTVFTQASHKRCNTLLKCFSEKVSALSWSLSGPTLEQPVLSDCSAVFPSASAFVFFSFKGNHFLFETF